MSYSTTIDLIILYSDFQTNQRQLYLHGRNYRIKVVLCRAQNIADNELASSQYWPFMHLNKSEKVSRKQLKMGINDQVRMRIYAQTLRYIDT